MLYTQISLLLNVAIMLLSWIFARNTWCVRARKEIGAEAIIPSGELMELLYQNGATKIYRDSYHASLGLGRYAVGLLWFKLFTGNSVLNNGFSQLDEEVSESDLQIARRCADSLSFE